MIEKAETMGRVNANDSDDDPEDSPIKGTNLVDENGELRRPFTKKRRTQKSKESIQELANGQKESANIAAAMREQATALNPFGEEGGVQAQITALDAKTDLILSTIKK